MRTPYYREQALEGIAREVITAYDPNLYYGVPRMIPIEDIIEAQGITLEYQCLRKTGCVLGETVFDDGGAIIYDYDIPGYTVIAVKGGTILIDSSLCREDASTGRLRFTCAHELAHWLLHKRLYSGTGESAAMMTGTNIVRTQNSALEMQANLLGSILLMPLPQVHWQGWLSCGGRCGYFPSGAEKSGRKERPTAASRGKIPHCAADSLFPLHLRWKAHPHWR